jgi:ABC-type transport system substrate-binding protein
MGRYDSRTKTPAAGWCTVLATVVVVALLAAGCSSSAKTSGATSATIGDEGTPVDGGDLIIAVGTDTAGWNPHDNQWAQAGSLVGSSVLEPLATTDADLNAVPWLATSWMPNATYDSYTIVLRSGVTFQNGEPFDGAAVKLNIDDASRAVLSGQAIRGLIDRVTVVDDHTVTVDLAQPWAAFPSSFLNGQSSMMMAPKMLNSPKRGTDHPIGTGPYTFASWQPGSTFKTTKNVTYWQSGLPHLGQLEFQVLSDSSSQAAALRSGDANLVFTASASEANSLASQYTVVRDWGSEPGMAMTNTVPVVKGKPNALTNQHARLALAYATDRTALAATAGDGVQTPSSPFPPTSKWGLPEDQNQYVSFDLDKAKEQVALYEQDTGASSLAVTLTSTPDIDTARVTQLLQSQWKEAGIDSSIEALEATSFITNVVSGAYQVALFNIYSSPDPDQNHYFWSADTAKGVGNISINFTQLTNARMQADLKTGRESNDFATRKAAYDDLVQEINAQAVNIWTFSTPYSLIASKKVHGLAQPSQVPFGNFQPKTWLADLWLSS